MPVHKGSDKKGSYYRFGKEKKYYYKPGNSRSTTIAKNKAIKQGVAINYSKMRHGEKPDRI